MKLVLDWLQSLLSEPVSGAETLRILEAAGVEIEEVINSSTLDDRIITGKVLGVKAHPNANKLRLVNVEVGTGELEIVCGAPNVVEGQTVAVALEGATLPNGSKIKATEIRGVVSHGMLCSQKELNLGEDHSGIWVITKPITPGQPIQNLLVDGGNMVIDIKTAANRPDLYSMVGVAREIAAHSQGSLNWASPGLELHGQQEDIFENQIPELVPRVCMAKLSVKVGDSPSFIAQQLELAGIRSINNIVDITNYVMLETGQPLHAYDKAKIEGKILIRSAKNDEALTTLDEQDRLLAADDIVIADQGRAVGLGGIMGGLASQVTDDTIEIILEAANFDAATIRRSARRHGLNSEASKRFEHTLPLQFAPIGINRAIELLVEHASAELTAVQDKLEQWPWVQHIGVRPKRLSKLAGIEIDEPTTLNALHRLGFKAEKFDIVAEAKKHLGKPYKWGATYKTEGTSAFDCSYLTDYIYSLIGLNIGHTALAQFEKGQPVGLEELQPGDILFYEGANLDGKRRYSLHEIKAREQVHSEVGKYYEGDSSGGFSEVSSRYQGLVGHNGLYIGNNQIIDARKYVYQDNRWVELPQEEQKVQVVDLAAYSENPGFLGARRFVDNFKGWIAVDAPYWRPDIKNEEDILEEVVKIIGLDKIPATLPKWQPNDFTPDRRLSYIRRLREAMKNVGLMEVTTYPFVSEQMISELGSDLETYLRISNPRSVEQSYLRMSMLPSLLSAVKDNTRYSDQFGIFEIARVFIKQTGVELPKEPEMLGVAAQSKDIAYLVVKGALDEIARVANINFELRPIVDTNFKPGRVVAISAAGQNMGIIGELHPRLTRKLKGQAAYLELDIKRLIELWQEPTFRSLPRFQIAERDITVWLDDPVHWADISAAINQSNLVRPAYNGDYYIEGRRALTVKLTIEPTEGNLTDAEIEQRVKAVIELLSQNFGAKLKE